MDFLPHAVITVDRFHVAKAINAELKALKNKEKTHHPEALKGSHYPLLKNQINLTDTQQETLQRVYAVSPVLKMGHRLKECLHHIFESHSTKEKATQRIQKWLAISESHGLFPDFGRTLLSWLDNITNYFLQRTTSGIVEGINNKIKLIKRRAFGFRNFGNFRLRVIAAFL